MEDEIKKNWIYIKDLFKNEKNISDINKFEYELKRILREQKLKRILS